MNRREAIRTARALWKEHRWKAFPPGFAGTSVRGIEVAMLDTFAAGCIHTFMSRNCKLDLWRTAILGRCYRDFSVAALSLKGPKKAYCKRWATLCGLVLQIVQLGVQKKSYGRVVYVLDDAA
jgi:hypothetical protein